MKGKNQKGKRKVKKKLFSKKDYKKIFLTLILILVGILLKWAWEIFNKNGCWSQMCTIPSIGFGGFLASLIFYYFKWRYG